MSNITSDSNITINVTSQHLTAYEEVMNDPAYLIALLFMIIVATSANIIAGLRIRKKVHEVLKLKDMGVNNFMDMADVAQFPVSAAITLCGLYFAFKVIGKAAINKLLFVYLMLASATCIVLFLRPYFTTFLHKRFGPILSGVVAVACITGYGMTRHWILNNFLSFPLCVVGIEQVPIKTFKAGAALLIALFFYDIFFVFGTDVMVTVATNVEGPIKILFPQHIFSDDHSRQSLLGLGDIVIPGFFMAQMLRFGFYKHTAALYKAEKKNDSDSNSQKLDQNLYQKLVADGEGLIYWKTQLMAYVGSLVTCMFFMVVYDSAQPALLYIVPFLLLAAVGTAAYRGELQILMDYDEDKAIKVLFDVVQESKPVLVLESRWRAREMESMPSKGMLWYCFDVFLLLIGFDAEQSTEEND